LSAWGRCSLGGMIFAMIWKVYFHAETGATLGDGDAVASSRARVLERAVTRMRIGQPFFIHSDGIVDVRINRWFCSDDIRGLAPLTWKKYAYSLWGSRSRSAHLTCGDGRVRWVGHDRRPWRCVCSI
jgi:hypothetical protein